MSYTITLSESVFPAQAEGVARDPTPGDQLHETAEQFPDKTGLVEVDTDAEQLLIFPRPDVEQFIQFKTENCDRWLCSMRKLRRNIISEIGSTRLEGMHKLV